MAIGAMPSEVGHWEAQYQTNRPVWENFRPDQELQRVVEEQAIPRGRAIEFGCGTGVNTGWLASQGFEALGVDLSPLAIRRARQRAALMRVPAAYLAVDLRTWRHLDGPFDFFFDRGCYHAVRRTARQAYLETLTHVTRPGSLGLILTGNAEESEDALGPPVVPAEELIAELRPLFTLVQLRAFRFESTPALPHRRYLGWSCLIQRR